jgi:predicted DNA-binding transcriptional regulator AlpA
MSEKTKRYVDEKEVSRITSISLSTLRNHRYLRKGIQPIKIGRAVRYSLEDVVAFMESHKISTDERR